jgi:hypothetical protein
MTMTDNTCNGWRNAATWTVNLWFGDGWAEMAHEGMDITADYCREQVEEMIEDRLGSAQSGIDGFIWDMMDLRSVDWYELAAHHAPMEEDA